MVKNSGFQDVVFCSGVCTYGSLTLNGALACSHYNCAWQIHSTFLEGLEQCLYMKDLDTKTSTVLEAY